MRERWVGRCDISPLLPASFSVPDAALLLASCPSASRAGAKVMAQTCLVAPKLIQVTLPLHPPPSDLTVQS